MNKLTPDKIEIATLRRVNGKTVISVMESDEMTVLIKKFEEAEKAAEEAKREKELAVKAEGIKIWRLLFLLKKSCDFSEMRNYFVF